MMVKELKVYQNCKFHNPVVGVLVLIKVCSYKLYGENELFLLKSSSLRPGIGQTKYTVMITEEGSIKLVNLSFMTLRAGVFVLERGHIGPTCMS